MARFCRTKAGYVRIAGGSAHLLDAPPWAGGSDTGRLVGIESSEMLACVSPTKIVCVGRNYKLHAAEMKGDVPSEPLLFFKPPSAILASGGTVRLPRESERVDYEGELAVVIGHRARRVAKTDALGYVFGYTALCDVTARDLQKKDGQWGRAKGFDTFCPIGSFIATDSDPTSVGIRTTVNGETRQDGNTRDMVFGVEDLVVYISSIMTLEPGDLIATGTPDGVGAMSVGDRVCVSIDGVDQVEFDVASDDSGGGPAPRAPSRTREVKSLP